MIELETPVSAIPKIGPKYKKLLEKLDIFTVEDLLYHFPFRFDDFSEIKRINEVKVGETVTINGILGELNNIYTKFGKRLTKAKLVDETGSLDLIWFNSHFLKRVLIPNRRYNISGKVGSFGNKITIIAPTYELTDEVSLSTGRLVPIYPETSGLSSKWLRSRINDIFSKKVLFEEFLPKEILEKENFPNIDEAFYNFHFPNTEEESKRAKKRFQFEELFLEMLNVESRKYSWTKELKAVSVNNLDYDLKLNELIKSLPFELTDSQKTALDAILHDLKKPTPMNRLLEGDVGTGKTIVAVIASYFTFLNQYNTLYMAPTEILAKQHYETYKKLLEPFNVNVYLLTGSKKETDVKEPYILIGTHALLYGKRNENVGLVIIDEQHRFGVEQRTKLLNINKTGTTPHLLTMTATPIPRTLALTIYGDLEISPLHPIPTKKRNVTTKVVPEGAREKAFEWIKAKKEQAFIVCPFIEESDYASFENVKAATTEFEKLQKGVFKGLKIGLLHGKMKSDEKSAIVKKFENKEINILVSTPVIEVGIDIPEATIIVIESSERYGLASLHQLRGRVGRGLKPGYCFLFMSSHGRDSYNRLKNLERIDDGLELAEIDLKLRGHGDIYGTQQSGFSMFKIADLSDLVTLEKAKKYSQAYFSRLEQYPNLQVRINKLKGKYIGKN